MADFTVHTGRLRTAGFNMVMLALKVGMAKSRVESVSSSLSFEIKQKSNIQKNLRTIVNDLNAIQKSIIQANSTLQDAARYYENAEKENSTRFALSQLLAGFSGGIPGLVPPFVPGNFQPIFNWFHDHFHPSTWIIGPGGHINWNHIPGLIFAGGISATGAMSFFKLERRYRCRG